VALKQDFGALQKIFNSWKFVAHNPDSNTKQYNNNNNSNNSTDTPAKAAHDSNDSTIAMSSTKIV
jgi:hypothetical protein